MKKSQDGAQAKAMAERRESSGTCPAHARQAREVLALLATMTGRPIGEESLSLGVSSIVTDEATALSRLRGTDALQAALSDAEKMRASGNAPDWPRGSLEAQEGLLGLILLGPVACRTAWNPRAVLARQVLDVVDERVQLLGGCTCVE